MQYNNELGVGPLPEDVEWYTIDDPVRLATTTYKSHPYLTE